MSGLPKLEVCVCPMCGSTARYYPTRELFVSYDWHFFEGGCENCGKPFKEKPNWELAAKTLWKAIITVARRDDNIPVGTYATLMSACDFAAKVAQPIHDIDERSDLNPQAYTGQHTPKAKT